MVLYYVNGRWATTAAAVRARFPNAHSESISVTAAINDGDWLDVETGDAFPWEAPAWCVSRRNFGRTPGVYVEYSKWAATRNEFHMRGIPEPRWWIALWDRNPSLLPGADGKQYDHPPTSGGHYDLSVFNYTFGGDSGQKSGGSFMAGLTDAQQAQLAQQIADIHGSFGTAAGETLVTAFQKAIEAALAPLAGAVTRLANATPDTQMAQQITDMHGSFGTAAGETLVTAFQKELAAANTPLAAQTAQLIDAINNLSDKIDALYNLYTRPSASPGP